MFLTKEEAKKALEVGVRFSMVLIGAFISAKLLQWENSFLFPIDGFEPKTIHLFLFLFPVFDLVERFVGKKMFDELYEDCREDYRKLYEKLGRPFVWLIKD